jgi:RES domain-containing protein
MAPSESTLSAAFDGVAFRYSNYDTPFWARPNTDAGRWHAAGEPATQYWSVAPEGAWAELIRHEHLRDEREVAEVRMSIWVAEFRYQRIADYSDFARADTAAGVSAKAVVAEDYAACQAEGRRLRDAGFQGVIAPSAALPGVLNLTLFGPRLRSGWSTSPRLSVFVAATVVALGSPPPGMTRHVRQVGEPHSGLLAYLTARD